MTSEREAFEKAYKEHGHLYGNKDEAWDIWQAARQDWPSEDEAVEIMRGSYNGVLVDLETLFRDAYSALRNAPQDRG